MKKLTLTTILLVLSSINSLAQSAASRSSLSAREVVPGSLVDTKNLLSVDTFPMVVGGLGMAYDRILVPRMSFGLYGNFETLKSNDSGDNSMKLQTRGIRTRYFMTGEAARQGFYLSGAMVNVGLTTTVRVLNVEGTGSDRKTGFLGGAGYQLLGREINSGKFILNLAVLGGTGLGADYTARSAQGVTTVETSLKNGLSAEASLGFLF
jgi:hypothetical protein